MFGKFGHTREHSCLLYARKVMDERHPSPQTLGLDVENDSNHEEVQCLAFWKHIDAHYMQESKWVTDILCLKHLVWRLNMMVIKREGKVRKVRQCERTFMLTVWNEKALFASNTLFEGRTWEWSWESARFSRFSRFGNVREHSCLPYTRKEMDNRHPLPQTLGLEVEHGGNHERGQGSAGSAFWEHIHPYYMQERK